MEVEIKLLPDSGRRLFVSVAGQKMTIETLVQKERHAAVISLLKKAAARLEGDIHSRRFGISIADRGDVEQRMYAFSTRREDTDWYFPCYLFDQPFGVDYPNKVAEIVEKCKQPPVVDKAFWIGLLGYHPSRIEMFNLGWRKGRGICDFRGTGPDGADFVPFTEFGRFSTLVDIQGWGYSGRLPLLLATGRPVIVIDRPFEQAWYFNQLKPWVHYIPAREDLANLIPTVKWSLENKEWAKKIGLAGQAFALEHLTQDKMVNRIVEIIYHEAGLGLGEENPPQGDGTSAQSREEPPRTDRNTI